MDVLSLQQRSGWTVEHRVVTTSTNDEAARLVEQGAPARTVVVADRQTAGRGREARRFASPAGGLYVSLLLDARPEHLPGGIVALVAVAAAEAIEAAVGAPVQIKWPNDLWLGGRKAGGILLEMSDASRPVVAGIGVNLQAVPDDLPSELRASLTALDEAAGHAVAREALLADLLGAVDRWSERLAAGALTDLETAWQARLALVGRPIRCTFAGRPLEGVLEDASLRDGLLIRDAVSGPVWRQAEHVQDLRPAARTIS